jgi:glyoxylase-like metal-dependent hydrolase (beta-lactamase superfamily II)
MWGRPSLSCHCLLVETPSQLILVDTGMGADLLKTKLSSVLARKALGIKFSESDSARFQIEKLGFSIRDVRHIILTHLDYDHAGGALDFPWAQVHVHADEFNFYLESAHHRRWRYRLIPRAWRSQIKFQTYGKFGDTWNGFRALRTLEGIPDDIFFVPLPGHSPGHCGVALPVEGGWMFHGGDAFFLKEDLARSAAEHSLWSEAFQSSLATDNHLRHENLRRLRVLAHTANDVRIINSHDPELFPAGVKLSGVDAELVR